VVYTAKSALFVSAEEHTRTAMRAVEVHHANVAVGVAIGYKVLTKHLYSLWVTIVPRQV